MIICNGLPIFEEHLKVKSSLQVNPQYLLNNQDAHFFKKMVQDQQNSLGSLQELLKIQTQKSRNKFAQDSGGSKV